MLHFTADRAMKSGIFEVSVHSPLKKVELSHSSLEFQRTIKEETLKIN
jgi:hypothetical protein